MGMTDTEALRRALEVLEGIAAKHGKSVATDPIYQAAHRWLALAEGDEAVVERVAIAFALQAGWTFHNVQSWDPGPKARSAARAVLAAITEEGE